MGRARAGVLDGALRSVVKHGTRATTMSGIATLGGVAKATVYNHFRTKDEVWAALVAEEVQNAAVVAKAADPAAAFAALADHLAEHPARVTLAEREPEVLARLVSAAPSDPACLALVAAALRGYGLAADSARLDLVLRTAASFLVAPGSGPERHALAAQVTAALSTASEVEPTAASASEGAAVSPLPG